MIDHVYHHSGPRDNDHADIAGVLQGIGNQVRQHAAEGACRDPYAQCFVAPPFDGNAIFQQRLDEGFEQYLLRSFSRTPRKSQCIADQLIHALQVVLHALHELRVDTFRKQFDRKPHPGEGCTEVMRYARQERRPVRQQLADLPRHPIEAHRQRDQFARPFSGNGAKLSAPRNASTAFAVSWSGLAMRRTMKYDVKMTITAPMTPIISVTYSG